MKLNFILAGMGNVLIKQLLKSAGVLLLTMFFQSSVHATDYFWVGGSGTWSDFTNHWATTSGGSTFHTSAPTTNDDVYFDANSFGPAGGAVVTNSSIFFKSMDWSTVTNNPAFDWVNSGSGAGSITLSPNMTFIHASSCYIFTSGTANITSAGHSFNNFGFDPGGGTYNLLDNFKANSLEVNAGSFNSNMHSIDLTGALTFNNFAGQITANIVASRITCKNWRVVGNTPINYTDSDAQITLLNAGSEFQSGGVTYNSFVTVDSVDNSFLMSGATSISFLTINGGNTVNIQAGDTFALMSLALNSSSGNGITLQSNSAGTRGAFTIGSSICAEYLTIQDHSISGASASAGFSTDNGNNSGWTFLPGSCITSTEAALNCSISIGPNPSTGVINISSADILSGSIFDLTGSKVGSIDEGSNKVDISDLPAGQYLLQLTTSDESVIKKIVKN